MTRSVLYTSSPLLASKTPVWRSKFIVASLALGFAVLAGRAAWVQVFGNDFFRKQVEVRFVRTLELPANRGRILDRNGLLLATSVPSPSIWAIPEDVDKDPGKLAQLARLLQISPAELDRKLQDEDKTFVWLKRQVDDEVAQKIAALGLKGIHQRKEYKRQYPEGEAAAHVVGFTNVEDQGQEGMELAFNQDLGGRPGSRRVIKDRAWARWWSTSAPPCRRWTGATCSCPSTARCSSSPGRSCATRWPSTRPRPAAWWCWTC
jgi:cell division protein FtsI (penicillin-binding protein 3)